MFSNGLNGILRRELPFDPVQTESSRKTTFGLIPEFLFQVDTRLRSCEAASPTDGSAHRIADSDNGPGTENGIDGSFPHVSNDLLGIRVIERYTSVGKDHKTAIKPHARKRTFHPTIDRKMLVPCPSYSVV
jgi:hypothetical protein